MPATKKKACAPTRRKHAIYFEGPGMAKQSFKDECDINKIMEKFQRTGALQHYANNISGYGDATGIELQDALNVVAKAETMFEELPSSIRAKFENDPTKFLDFVNDEKNLEEMRELGLAPSAVKPEVKEVVERTEKTRAGDNQEQNAEK